MVDKGRKIDDENPLFYIYGVVYDQSVFSQIWLVSSLWLDCERGDGTKQILHDYGTNVQFVYAAHCFYSCHGIIRLELKNKDQLTRLSWSLACTDGKMITLFVVLLQRTP